MNSYREWVKNVQGNQLCLCSDLNCFDNELTAYWIDPQDSDSSLSLLTSSSFSSAESPRLHHAWAWCSVVDGEREDEVGMAVKNGGSRGTVRLNCQSVTNLQCMERIKETTFIHECVFVIKLKATIFFHTKINLNYFSSTNRAPFQTQ